MGVRGRDRARDDDGFARFVRAHERRLRQALTSALGEAVGREATVEALSYGWEHWGRVSVMENPVGYLFTVGRERATRHDRRRRDRPNGRPVPPPPDESSWFEPALPALVAELSERERQVVMLVFAFDWTMSEVAGLLDVSGARPRPRGRDRRHWRALALVGTDSGSEGRTDLTYDSVAVTLTPTT